MTEEQKTVIHNFRTAGVGYKAIAVQMGISENTVKTYCRRNGLGGIRAERTVDKNIKLCHCCGVVVAQTPGRKLKRFCSDKCRNKWWNSHLYMVNRKAVYWYECSYCKKPFSAYGNSKRKYCSHECYINDRFGEIEQEVTIGI